jgi:hypothetical protein
MRKRWAWLLLLVVLPIGCVAENILSDPATRLSFQIRDEAKALRRSGKPTATFVQQPSTFWPDHFTGDYQISFHQMPGRPAGDRSLATEQTSGSGPRSGTTYHLNYVTVAQDLAVQHHLGEPTLVTLELHDGKVVITGLK